MNKHNFCCVATDCGGSGCKSLFAEFDGNKVLEREYRNFPNPPLYWGNNVFCDINAIYRSTLEIMGDFSHKYNNPDVLGFDTHGALYFLLDSFGRLVRMPYHRLDHSYPDIMDRLYEKISRKRIYELTGSIATRGFSLPWMYADILDETKAIESADKLLMFSDMLIYLYTGVMVTDRTSAGTTCMSAADQKEWSWELLKKIGAPEHLFLPFTEPCTKIGRVNKQIEELTGIKNTQVAMVVGHDSAAAVSAVPDFGKNKLYVGLGTVANINFLSDKPFHDEKGYHCGLKTTSYLGKDEYMIYHDCPAFQLFNFMLQVFAKQGHKYSYDEINEIVRQADKMKSYVDLDMPELPLSEGEILEVMKKYLIETKQDVPETNAEWIRCFFNSLVMKIKEYKVVLEKEFEIAIEEIVVLNGGSLHKSLMQLIADECAVPVKGGMKYATLLGNTLNQLLAVGEVSTVDEMRELSRQSFRFQEYEPKMK